jgi:drug/metabolite transporter (DMT)-like permease
LKNAHLKHIFELLLATFFISTSGVLGKYIEMPPPVIVWWRSSLAMIFLFVYCRYKNINLKISSPKDGAIFILGAIFMAAHWITYFYALKLSNVALGMLSLYTFPVITSLLEPVFMKIKFNPIHIVLGLIVLLGIYILAPEFNLESSHVQGIGLGLISALCYSLRILIMKQYVVKYNSTMLMFYQVVMITVLLAPTLFLMNTANITTQYPYVLLLALLTTAIGHTLMVRKFKYFSVSTASIISSVQPIFGIILAFFFLSEIPTLNTFLGGLLILSTVAIESIRSKKK